MSDAYSAAASHRSPVPIREFILKFASRCNLACDYCYVYTMADQTWRSRPSLIDPTTIDAATRRIGEHASRHQLRQVTVIMHGGEPLLAGQKVLNYVASAARRELPGGVNLELRLQTNGVLLDEALLRVFRSRNIRVGVSIDGAGVHHDLHRHQRDGRGSYAATTRGLRLLTRPENRDLYAGLLCVIDTRNDPVAVYEALLEFSPPALDFLLPHGNWSAPPPGLGPETTPYAQWLIAVFDRWYGAPRQETAVRLFQELINLLLGGRSRTEQVGLSPVAFVVIDTDGSFEQVDTLKSAHHGAAHTGLNVFDHAVDSVLHHPDVRARQLGLEALSAQCLR
ncbi:MAG: FxsB family cyclophane-forming radical SAM/SPASM peptide maturase, partial [Candidatus Dormibacteria bacterium]